MPCPMGTLLLPSTPEDGQEPPLGIMASRIPLPRQEEAALWFTLAHSRHQASLQNSHTPQTRSPQQQARTGCPKSTGGGT